MSNDELPRLSLEQAIELMRLDDARKAAELEDIRKSVAESAIPLSDDLLARMLRLFPTDADLVLQSHPGFVAAERRGHFRAALSIAKVSLDDLDAALREFEELATSDGAEILLPRNQERLGVIENRIQKELFSTANAAASLVDHVRRVRKRFDIPNFEDELFKVFDSGLHDLIIGLRVLLHHLHIVRANWTLSADYSAGTRTAGFDISRSEIERALDASGSRFDGNNGENIRRFLRTLPDRIDLRSLFLDYRACIERFYGWFDLQVVSQAPAELADYDRCKLAKERHSTRMMWNALIGNWLNWETIPDFHSHLPNYLTEEQLGAVRRLPRNSEEQADLIINFIDQHGAANDDFRKRVYELFKRRSEQEAIQQG